MVVAHVAWQRNVLLHRGTIFVLAGPSLNGVELIVVVENVCVDDGGKHKESSGTCRAESEQGTQSVLVGEVDLGLC